MNNKEFYRALAEKSGMTYKDCKYVMDMFVELIHETLPEQDIVIKNLGKFSVSKLKERKIKLNNEIIDAKAKFKPKFTPSLELKWIIEDEANR